ncbi:hypothetical protein FB451DRAFT_1458178 [Mycena latifolia]|nr:hypothetical protein FB451DRAFT_1458178 [Mycena latifolia]
MSPGRHHTGHPKNMAILIHAQSSSNDLQADPSNPAFDSPERRTEGALDIDDTTATMIYPPVPSTATILRASQVALPPEPTTTIAGPTPPTRISNRELAFVITAALFGLGVLLMGAGIAHLMRRRGRGRLSTPRSADIQERGLDMARDFDDSSWGTKGNRFQEAEAPCSPTASTFTPWLSHPDVAFAYTEDRPTPSTELTAILEQFEQRLYQEETDIALALHIAFGDESCPGPGPCAPFFAGSEDDVNTMLSLQAGMESVGKRSGGIRNRARQGSDASASSQSTTVTVEGFSSHSSSASSLTSMDSTMSDIEESAEEAEADVVYEVKRAQTHSMEIQKGKLITWQPGGVRLMVTGPSTTTLGSASSSLSVDLDEFPLPP